VLCALLGGTSAPVQGNGNLARQRQLFLEAEQAQKYKHDEDYQQFKYELTGYPLLMYLEYKEARDDLSKKIEISTRQFLRNNPDTRLAYKLRNDWLSKLIEQERWQEFLVVSANVILSNELRCHRVNALLATNKRQQAFSEIRSLWLTSDSLPECDNAFDIWHTSGQLTSDLVWQRIALAMEQNQSNLVRNIKKYLIEDDQQWVELWLKIYWNPDIIINANEFLSAHTWRETILIDGLARLAKKSPRAAPSAWNTLKSRYVFTAEQKSIARHSVASAYLSFATDDVIEKITNIDGIVDANLQQRRILLALSQGRWVDVQTRIDALPQEEKSSLQWQYWKARSLEKLGRNTEANTLFAQVALDRTYYAFLAAERSGRDYYLVNRPLHVSSTLLNEMSQNKTVLCAKELRALGRMADARTEWRWLIKELDVPHLQAAARLAADWNWHDQAIFTLAKTGFWDDLNLRFPLEHKNLIQRYATENNIPVAWAFAILRQESTFASDAMSKSGALGLMQLMPATAKQVAGNLGKSFSSNMTVLQPEFNIALGTNYLSTVANKFDRHLVLATAAYNAGPGRVTKWLPHKATEADVWVENIPFQETKIYVQRVMAYMVLYEKRLGLKPSSILQRMKIIPGK
jgi:soluble lytic murein transglycosylase